MNNIRRRINAPVRACLIAVLALMIVSSAMPGFSRAAGVGNDRVSDQSKSEYRARRQKLMEQIKDGIVVLVGAREEDFGEVGRFRQRNDLMYLTGAEIPAAYLILVPASVASNKTAQEMLFIPARNPRAERWTGPKLGPGPEAVERFGIQEVVASDKFNERLRQLFAPKTDGTRSQLKVYTVIPRGPGAELTREHNFVENLKQSMAGIVIEDVSGKIAEMRKIKSQAEIALLQKAIDITGEAQRDAARTIKPGAMEYEAQAALEYAFSRNGAERSGFPSIVGSGFNSTVLHYNENRKRIEAGDLVVVDIGAEYSYYTADITRTYPASGKFTPRQREVYQLVLDAQRAAERAFKPGQSSLGQLQQAAIEVMKASKLRDSAGNTLERYFIHGLGHWLGMDVHDVGSYGVMPVGSVFTIEPGIYIPEEKLGVRIEDDYLVTETGLVKMSRNIPFEPDEIERLMSQPKNTAGSSSHKEPDKK